MRIDIERIKKLKAELSEFNKMPLDKIRFYENGERVYIDPKIIKDFEFTGLNNVDFVMTNFYKGGFDESEEET